MKIRSAALHLFWAYKRTEDGGQTDYNSENTRRKGKKGKCKAKKKISQNKHANEQTNTKSKTAASLSITTQRVLITAKDL
jgi:hypothetical protein